MTFNPDAKEMAERNPTGRGCRGNGGLASHCKFKGWLLLREICRHADHPHYLTPTDWALGCEDKIEWPGIGTLAPLGPMPVPAEKWLELFESHQNLPERKCA